MSGKYRSREEFQKVKEKFFWNCVNEKGHSLELTTEVWRQTESFAGYAFAKGHSASYAVESYQSLFLKAYYPLEYMVATINNFGGLYRTELYVLEAKLHGGIIHEPCVNQSEIETSLYGNDIYLGFHLLHGFESKNTLKIVEEKMKNGVFKDFDDFLDRVLISLEQMSILIRIDAFRFTKKDKRTLLWELHFKMKATSKNKKALLMDVEGQMLDMFKVQRPKYKIPALENSIEEDTFDQLELLGFPINSFFDIIRDVNDKSVLAENLYQYVGKVVTVRGYLIHRKNTQTKNHEAMFFGTFLDEKGQWLDTVHFPQVAANFHFRGTGVYIIKGKVTAEYDCILIEVCHMEKADVIEDPRYVEVKDAEKEKTVVTRNRRINHRIGFNSITNK